LEGSRRVRWQEGNYNDRLTVPLIFFGQPEPGILNVFAWMKIILKNERIIRKKYPYQIVVAELGTDAPGQIARFEYLKPDMAVITAVAPEHMEYFGTLDAVAAEELSLAGFAGKTLINADDVPSNYLAGREYLTYGLTKDADYHFESLRAHGTSGQSGTVHLHGHGDLDVQFPLLGRQGAKTVLAAIAAAHLAGLTVDEMRKGLDGVAAFPGRMQVLQGIHDSMIIDDSYNSSPAAEIAALEVLQSVKATQRIALLGSMNELGDYSAEAHWLVANQCDPDKLDLVLTLGPDANRYLAPVAKEKGCVVKTFWSPYEAGHYIAHELKDEGVVLVKGSQNRVFAEEAIKALLADKNDSKKLVRQSAHWMGVKRKQFKL
jgi:UDP-N-acetylmuramoyl-tripeptide--D-alanyl-D-alanine ligase